ncbi:germacradienol/geosmin synthase, partial [Nonomuraea sp. MG754425]|uniref:terpene synthase family protein n=1 Tax=Nonomuraea sp. MG754425 TaxID=2570319 RepID=UPI001F356FA4
QSSPPRLSPFAASVVAHSTLWARDMGMFEPVDRWGAPLWDEVRFESMAIPLMAAYGHPDATPGKLELVSDWYVWAYWFDDHFTRMFKQPRARRRAQDHVNDLHGFTPFDSPATPAPSNPIEYGLASLWSRTFSGSSPGWRRRFAASTQGLIRGCLRELDNIRDDRVPNPIEYIGLRRASGVGPWVADLVEYVSDAEMPAKLVDTRPLKGLRDAFADGVHLLNDLCSYQREVGEEDEHNNGVLVFQQFLRCGAQEAAERVHELRMSRLRQFEDLAATELPRLMQERGLDPEERRRFARYVQGLSDWLSGTGEWHRGSSRYIAAATAPERPALAPTTGPAQGPAEQRHTPGYPFRLPEFTMPWEVRVNPHRAVAREASRAWAHEMGIVGAPGGVWPSDRYEAMRFADWCAMACPDATPERLELMALWFTWVLALDDYFIVEYKASRDLPGARLFLGRLPRFMPAPGEGWPSGGNCVERALADLWERTSPTLRDELREVLRREVLAFAAGNLWEMGNSARQRVPDPIDYIEMSRVAKGIGGLGARLVALIQELDISEERLSGGIMRELVDVYADHLDLTNDIVSYRREIETERHLNNGVLAVRAFLGCDLQEAVDVVNDQLTACVLTFERLAGEGLPGPDAAAYVEGLRHWMSANLAWHVGNSRYVDLDPVPEGDGRPPRSSGLVSEAPAPSEQGLRHQPPSELRM